MAIIKPAGSVGTQITVGSYTVFASESTREYDVYAFERDEWKHQRLRAARNSDNTIPRIMETLVTEVQVGYACGLSDTPRPLTPDDVDVTKIYRQFNIVRYRFTGATSNPAAVEYLAGLANNHRQNWQVFESRQKLIQSGNVSYQDLVQNFQPEQFTYLTSTGITITGMPVNNGTTDVLSNVLIRQFNLTHDFIVPQVASPSSTANYVEWKGWNMVVEQLTDVAQTF